MTRTLLHTLVFAFLLFGAANPSFGGLHVVTNNANDGPGTLRDIIENQAFSGDTIVFDDTMTIVLDSQIVITRKLVIISEGVKHTTIRGAGIDRLFHILGFSTDSVHFRNIRFTGGNITSGFGGGFFIESPTAFYGCRIDHCSSFTGGGGLACAGGFAKVLVLGSTIDSCTTNGSGGGIHLSGQADINIVNSTISGNSSNLNGGGVFAPADPLIDLVFYSSTIANNNSTAAGGGVYASTFVSDSTHSSIFADNSAFFAPPDYASQDLTVFGDNNILETGIAALSGLNNQSLDPNLDVLDDNGNCLPTHAPNGTSIAIDMGIDYYGLFNDQRGAPRELDGDQNNLYQIDVGAVEYTPFCVTTTANTGLGSLNDHMLAANTHPGLDYICFKIPGNGPHIIGLTSSLPDILDDLIIDGFSQKGAYWGYGTYQHNLKIEIRYLANVPNGFVIPNAGSFSQIRGMSIVGFDNAGILMNGSHNNLIHGNYIGLAVDNVQNSNKFGIQLMNGAFSNEIGGVQNKERNVISANDDAGIYFNNAGALNSVIGNYIGTMPTGLVGAVNDSATGVVIENTTACFIGDATKKGNVISGFGVNGAVHVLSNSGDNSIINNFIGVGVDGALPIPNNFGVQVESSIGTNITENIISRHLNQGIIINSNSSTITIRKNLIGVDGLQNSAPNNIGIEILDNSSNVTIGDPVLPSNGNVISNNINEGVRITNGGTAISLYNNFIGVDPSGTLPMGNQKSGILIDAASVPVTIGNILNTQRNIISGNLEHGIEAHNNSNKINGNIIGLDINGDTLGNLLSGIFLTGDSNLVAADSTTRNIVSANKNGIEILGGHHNQISGNYIGTGFSSTQLRGNKIDGILIHNGATNNSVKGSFINPCVVSGNWDDGIQIDGFGTRDNLIEGVFIGTDATGTSDVANDFGVRIQNQATKNTIGGGVSGNTVISGNDSTGVVIADADSNFVFGCAIGIQSDLLTALPNYSGIRINNGSKYNEIGGVVQTTDQNIISGNLRNGISIQGVGTAGNFVYGNMIGTDKAGTAIVANGGSGISIFNQARDNKIGDGIDGAGNVISGHSNGIKISDVGTKNNQVYNNKIGTDVSGTFSLPNRTGIHIHGADSNIIGGNASFWNIISGNDSMGVWLNQGATRNWVLGNYIGLDSSGVDTIPNLGAGINVTESSFNQIGDSMSLERGNIIAGNKSSGILISGGGSMSNRIQGNKIGTDKNGLIPLPNLNAGITISGGSSKNKIGGSLVELGNLISGNDNEGIKIKNSSNDTVVGNKIGTDISGTLSIGIQQNGIIIDSSSTNNIIGGLIPANEHNIISGNDTVGITLLGTGTFDNTIAGNFIGLDINGADTVPNLYGLGIAQGANNNTIGSTNPMLTNYIGGNDSIAVGMVDPGTNNNRLIGNYIGTGITTTEQFGAHFGVYLANGPQNNIIGGELPGESNHITDHVYGIIISGANTTNDSVVGNFIGVDTSGFIARPNTFGVAIGGGSQNTIVFKNLISGNDSAGVIIGGTGTSTNFLWKNTIGANKNIDGAVPGQKVGVFIGDGATDNTIGGTYPDESNVISGNYLTGVGIGGSGTNLNTVSGNYIGCDTLFSGPIANFIGVLITDSAKLNNVGTDISTSANYISGNDTAGVYIADTTTNLNRIHGNYIGTQKFGVDSLPNKNGIIIDVRADLTQIGDTLNSLKRNVISGNTEFGIRNAGNFTQIQGNFIGVDSSGSAALSNEMGGIHISGGFLNNIGGVNVNQGNVISGNGGNGIEIGGSTSTQIRNNLIGVDKNMATTVGNDLNGIDIRGPVLFTVVGGNNTNWGNVIGGNKMHGIKLGTTPILFGGYTINANYIGTDTTGTLDFGNDSSGIQIEGAISLGNKIGDSLSTNPHNTIAFNGKSGIKNKIDLNNGFFRNVLYNNNQLGIDLGDEGETPNDPNDSDVGANTLQNHPTMLYAIQTGGGIGVQGYLESTGGDTFWLEFFGNYTANGDDEAREYIGGLEVTADGNGYAAFSQFFNVVTALDAGDSMRATASLGFNTSELGLQTVIINSVDTPIAPNDTAYCINDTANMAYLVATNIMDSAEVRWYEGDTSNFVGNDSILPSTTVGKTTYYVTQTIATVESAPDSVCVTIYPTVDSLVLDSVAPPLCTGDTNAYVELIAIGGTPPYTYTHLNTGNDTTSYGNGVFDSLPAGNNNFMVTDTFGCDTAYFSIPIPSPTPMILTMDSVNAECHDSLGQAIVQAFGGNGNYAYLWSNGGVSNITTDTVGTYTVTVTDGNGCSKVDSVNISEPAPIVVSIIDLVHVSCPDGSNGSFQVVVQGGTPNYNITFGQLFIDPVFEGDSTSFANLSGDTTYVIVISDSNGCSVVDSITISQPDSIVITFDSIKKTCNNLCTGRANANVSGGTPPYNYVWSSGETTQFADSLCFGLDSVVVTDSNGCIQVGIVQIDTFPVPTAIFDPDTVSLCKDSCGQVSALFTGGAGGPYYVVYTWDSLSTIISDTTENAHNDTTIELCPPISTFLAINYIHDSISGCESPPLNDTIIFNIELPPDAPIVDGTADICFGDTAKVWVTGSNQGDVEWYSFDSTQIGTTDTLNLGSLLPGTHNVYGVVRSNVGQMCLSSPSGFTITVTQVEANASNDTTICLPLSVQLKCGWRV